MADATIAGSPAPTPAPRPEFTSPEIEAARVAPDFADKMSRFQTLASTILDGSGKFSEAERVQAYVAMREMGVTGQLMGMGRAGSDRMAEVHRGDIGQKVQRLQSAQAAAVMPIGLAGDGPGAARAALAFYDNLSAADQDIFFQTGINPPLRNGRNFASVQGWRDNMNAAIQLGEYTRANRDLIASGATSRADDPKLAAALKLGSAADAGSASWSAMVLKLFEVPKDRIDLSDGARRLVRDIEEPHRASARYQEGSIASRTV